VLVTSGAIGIELSKLGKTERPKEIRQKQAAAAVGQCELMFIYDKLFAEYGHVIAQMLLTKDVVDNPIRKQNVINTFSTLIEDGVIPIINENDSVSTEEIEDLVFGDNDTLSAYVANLCNADLLVLLTDIDGLYSCDPRKDSGAKIIHTVDEVTDEIQALAGGAGTDRGTGGMATKIAAARIACENGINMVIAHGEKPELIYDILEGKPAGTLFKAKNK
jgi:glutamate 5-kinase